MSYSIQMSASDRRQVENMLSDIKGAGPRVTMRAVNKTLTGVKTDAASELTAVLNLTKASVQKAMSVRNVTISSQNGYFQTKGKPIPLIEFRNTRQTNKGVSVQTKKASSRKVIPKTSIMDMPSDDPGQGHTGVYRRKWAREAGAANMSKMDAAISRSGYVWSAVRGRYISIAWLSKKYRLPIEELKSARLPDYLQDGPIMHRVMDKADARMHKNLMNELNYELSKHQ